MEDTDQDLEEPHPVSLDREESHPQIILEEEEMIDLHEDSKISLQTKKGKNRDLPGPSMNKGGNRIRESTTEIRGEREVIGIREDLPSVSKISSLIEDLTIRDSKTEMDIKIEMDSKTGMDSEMDIEEDIEMDSSNIEIETVSNREDRDQIGQDTIDLVNNRQKDSQEEMDRDSNERTVLPIDLIINDLRCWMFENWKSMTLKRLMPSSSS